MAKYSVVLFHSTAHAIRAESISKRAGFQVKMIPTPGQLSSDCGMALRFGGGSEVAMGSAQSENRVPTNGIHAILGTGIRTGSERPV